MIMASLSISRSKKLTIQSLSIFFCFCLTVLWFYTIGAANPVSTVASSDVDQVSQSNLQTVALDIPVAQSDDDSEERIADGHIYIESTDLELTYDAPVDDHQIVGLRFQNVTLPPTATITSAYIEFTVEDTSDAATSLLIHAEAIDDAPTFTTENFNISRRHRTSTWVAWEGISPWERVDEPAQTPDLSAIVQQIVNREGWQPGNALAFIMTGFGNRVAKSFDLNPDQAPLLHIEYVTSETVPAKGTPTPTTPTSSQAPKNIILMIGDGMGPVQVDAASIYLHGEVGHLSFESAPYQAQMKTYSANRPVTDSAAAATAMATGHKVNNGVVSQQIPGNGRQLESSLEYFRDRCKMVGLVTTAYLSHATPAVFGAHEAERGNYEAIGKDLLNQSRPHLLFGGTEVGVFSSEAEAAGYHVVKDRAELAAVNPAINPYLLGSFEKGATPFEYDYFINRSAYYDTHPHLSEMTASALDILNQNPQGFFLMVEGAKIDFGGHENHLPRTIFETIEFANAVQVVLDWIAERDDTLLIVTADHETGGLSIIKNHGQGNFPTVSWSTGGHTDINVSAYAWGPNAEMVNGIIDNTDIYDITLGGNQDEPDCTGSNPIIHSVLPPVGRYDLTNEIDIYGEHFLTQTVVSLTQQQATAQNQQTGTNERLQTSPLNINSTSLALSTTFIDSTHLRVSIPADQTVGGYDLLISHPEEGHQATLVDAYTLFFAQYEIHLPLLLR